LDLRNARLSSLKRVRVRMHEVGAQIELVRVWDGRTQDEFGVASSFELNRSLRWLEDREVSGATCVCAVVAEAVMGISLVLSDQSRASGLE